MKRASFYAVPTGVSYQGKTFKMAYLGTEKYFLALFFSIFVNIYLISFHVEYSIFLHE